MLATARLLVVLASCARGAAFYLGRSMVHLKDVYRHAEVAERSKHANVSMTPLQQALLNDKPVGTFSEDGWISRDEFLTSREHFESFSRIPFPTFADKFLAIDESVTFKLAICYLCANSCSCFVQPHYRAIPRRRMGTGGAESRGQQCCEDLIFNPFLILPSS